MAMAKRLREHSISDDEAGDDEQLQGVSTSGPLHRTYRKFCPHCGEQVSLKTYRFHKRLRYKHPDYHACVHIVILLYCCNMPFKGKLACPWTLVSSVNLMV